MNTGLFFVVSVLCATLFGCVTSTPNTAGSSQSTTVDTNRVVGGFSVVDVADTSVRSCAEFAVVQHDPSGKTTLDSIITAERQVVAGLNYRLSLIVRRGGAIERAIATVWVPLNGTRELTSWESTRD